MNARRIHLDLFVSVFQPASVFSISPPALPDRRRSHIEEFSEMKVFEVLLDNVARKKVEHEHFSQMIFPIYVQYMEVIPEESTANSLRVRIVDEPVLEDGFKIISAPQLERRMLRWRISLTA